MGQWSKQQEEWRIKLQKAIDSGEYSEDQLGELKDTMTDYLDYEECEEVYNRLKN